MNAAAQHARGVPEPFAADASIKASQTLLQILFGTIPKPPTPRVKTSTHKSTSRKKTQSALEDTAEDTDDEEAKQEAEKQFDDTVYLGNIKPDNTAESFFDSKREEEFKRFIKAEIAKSEKFRGYPTADFNHRSSRTELDAA